MSILNLSYSSPYFLVVLLTILYAVRRYLEAKKCDIKVPVVGYSGYIPSFITAIRWIYDAKTLLDEGYAKHKNGCFKIPELYRWHAFVSGPRYVEELRVAPNDVLSFHEPTNQTLAVEYTFGKEVMTNPYHEDVIRTQLTRNIPALFPLIRDEIVQSFNDLIPTKGDEWVAVPMYKTSMPIVARTTNRTFVGLPLCRDPDYIELNIQFTIDVTITAGLINIFPGFMKPLVGRILTKVPRGIKRAMNHLRPLYEERMCMYEKHGKNWPGKPNDLLMWFMDEAKPEGLNLRSIALRILSINFAAIHTTSMTLTQAMFHLASQPEFAEPMREEITKVIRSEGWTKTAMNKLRRVDSFLKESQRHNGIGAISMTRTALKDFTFSDGTIIPKGAWVSVAAHQMHFDEDNYENAQAFDPWRFAELRDEEGEGLKHSMVSTNPTYLGFGHGKFACPGRFFAAHELKAMIAHVILNYDVKLEKEGPRPPNMYVNSACVPDANTQVMFRRRQRVPQTPTKAEL